MNDETISFIGKCTALPFYVMAPHASSLLAVTAAAPSPPLARFVRAVAELRQHLRREGMCLGRHHRAVATAGLHALPAELGEQPPPFSLARRSLHIVPSAPRMETCSVRKRVVTGRTTGAADLAACLKLAAGYFPQSRLLGVIIWVVGAIGGPVRDRARCQRPAHAYWVELFRSGFSRRREKPVESALTY